MNSRRYIAFSFGQNTLWTPETIIGPADIELFGEAFLGFFITYCAGKNKSYCVFATPGDLDDAPEDPLVIDYFATRGDLPKFDKARVLKYLFPDIGDIFELVDENKVVFERVFPNRRIRNLAWT